MTKIVSENASNLRALTGGQMLPNVLPPCYTVNNNSGLSFLYVSFHDFICQVSIKSHHLFKSYNKSAHATKWHICYYLAKVLWTVPDEELHIVCKSVRLWFVRHLTVTEMQTVSCVSLYYLEVWSSCVPSYYLFLAMPPLNWGPSQNLPQTLWNLLLQRVTSHARCCCKAFWRENQLHSNLGEATPWWCARAQQ